MGKLSAEQVIKRFNQLKSSRGVWETHWQDIIDFYIPERQDILISNVPGSKRRNHIFDSSGEHAMSLLNAALFSMLTPRQLRWMEFSTGDEQLDDQDDVRFFLQSVSRKFLKVLNDSNFYRAVQELYQDLSSVGTGIMAIEEDEDEIARFTVHTISDTVIDENNLGFIDEIYRKFEWTPKQIVMEFKDAKIPEKVQKAFNEGKNEKFCIIHAVYPSEIGQEESKIKMPYVSQYVLEETKEEIDVKGFREFSFVVPRWMKMSGEVYGRSPAMSALPEVKVINQMEKTVLKGAQKTIDPPISVTDDGLLTQPNTTPGGINWIRPGSEPIRPILNDARIDFGFQVTDRTRNRIRENFFIDQLQLQMGPQMTATEVERRVERQMQLLGPILARLEDEFLKPLVDRVFNIMIRRQIITTAEIPEVLQNRNIHPRFSSTIARAQKSSELLPFERTIQVMAPLVQADPTIMDNINGDEALQVVAKIQNLDQRLLRTRDEVAQIRQAKAQAAQQAAAAQQQAQDVDNASKLGQSVAQLKQAEAL